MKERVLTLVCPLCAGNRVAWADGQARYVSCPPCAGTGELKLAASSHVVGYLAGAKSVPEVIALLDRLAEARDTEVEFLVDGEDREGANLAVTEAAAYACVAEALRGLLRRLFSGTREPTETPRPDGGVPLFGRRE